MQVLLCDQENGRRRDAERTVTFAVDGQDYETDLCGQHLARMRRDFADVLAAARRMPPPGRVTLNGRARRMYERAE